MEKTGKRRLAAVMFTDIEGYTALVSANEERALSYVRTHRDTLHAQTEANNGEVIEFYGDGSLSFYDSAVDAVQCAIEMQKIYRSDDNIVPVRIGIHLGDVVMRDGSIFGNGVNVASRIESIGVSGNILVSEQVQKELKNQGHINAKALGKYKFKNVEEPIQIFGIDHPSVVMPNKKQLVGPKGKRVSNNFIRIIGSMLLIAALVFYYFGGLSIFQNKSRIVEERISVPPFKNFTGNSELDYIGDMSAHWLTKGLLQTENANVVAFHSNNEIQQLAKASAGQEINNVFAKQVQALNILDGSFSRISKDSVEFSAFIKKVDDGNVLYAFKPVAFSVTDPSAGIKKLSSLVNGYWEAHDELLLSMPNFEAYKYYMKARNIYEENDSLVQDYLLQSIQADSNFLDSYFLLMGQYYNQGKNEKRKELVNVVRPLVKDLSNYERNTFLIEEANLQGKNKKAFHIAIDDMKEYERDFFTTTDYVVHALEAVNESEKVIEIFNKYSFDELDLTNCAYCFVSHRLAAAAYIRLGQFDEAKKILDAVPEKSRNEWFFSVYIKLLSRQNDVAALETLIEDGFRLLSNDRWNQLYYIIAREFFIAGNTEISSQYAQKILDANPTDPEIIGWAHYYKGNQNEAQASFIQANKSYPGVTSIVSQIGVIQAKLGSDAKSWETIADLEGLKRAYDYGAVPYAQARIYYQLAEEERALTLLQQAVDEGAKFYTNNVFENDPDLQGLMDNPRFQKIVHPLAE